MSELEDSVDEWEPAPVITTDTIDAGPIEGFAALLDQPAPTGLLPPLWHWFFFLDHPRSDELGLDGHPTDGHFLPPVLGGGGCSRVVAWGSGAR